MGSISGIGFHTIVTKFTVDPSGMDAGLKAAEDKTKQFGQKSGGFFGSAFNGISQQVQQLSGANGLGGLTSAIAGAISGGFAGVIGGTLISGIVSAYEAGRQAVKEMGDEQERSLNLAETYGLTVAQLKGMTFAATQTGVDAEKLVKLMDAATEVSQDPVKLAAIGLDEAALKGKDFHQVLMKIIDAWKETGRSTAGGLTVMEQIGKKNYSKLMPLINQGSQGIGKVSGQIAFASGADAQLIAGAGDTQSARDMAWKETETHKAALGRRLPWDMSLFNPVAYIENAETNEKLVKQEAELAERRAIQAKRESNALLATKNEMEKAEKAAKETADATEKLLQATMKRFDALARDPVNDLATQFNEAQNLFTAGGLTPAQFGRGGMSLIRQLENALGIPTQGSFVSTLADATDMGTFAGQSELHKLANRIYKPGAEDKAMGERVDAIKEAISDRNDKVERGNRDLIDFFTEHGIILTAGPQF